MSLPDDFGMYYSGTYVGIQERDGTITPFYVDSVRWNPSASIDRDSVNDVSNTRHLVFRGNKLIKNPSNQGESYYYQNPITVSISDLILDVPLLGYYEVSGQKDPVWLYHLPQRSTKKGFTNNKTNIGQYVRNGNMPFLKLIYDIFNDTRTKVGRDFYQNMKNNNLCYKGVVIGKIVPEDGVVLKKSATYLTPLVEIFMTGV